MHVLLADNQVSGRTALKRLLEQEPELYLIGEAAEAESLLAQAQAIRPDLVLLNWELPGLPAADLLAALQALCGPLRVVVFSDNMKARQEAMTAGADAFVCKEDPLEWLLSTVYAVAGLSPCFVV
jgi:DNA-binding NarL/FixJ family response regulator